MDAPRNDDAAGAEGIGVHAGLCGAIARQSLVMFEYADLIRVVEPHRYGVNSAGHPMLSGWLRAGYSRSDPAGGWRNYLLSDISALQVLDAPFAGPRPGYAAHDARMRETYAELPAAAAPADQQVDGPYVVRERMPLTPATPPPPLIPPAPPAVTAQAERAASADAVVTHDGEAEPQESRG
ncbi:MAG: hypothetical protein JWL60_402 [Gemmatimonadetes bacterium]|jgi:hypothetical protein|nr:hypothetical protein [Gemmatimonadota bacterium]